MKEDDEKCEIQKPQMKNAEDKEHIIDPTVNIVFIFDLQMNNNCKNAIFGMQRSKDDMSGVLVELTILFVRSSRVFTHSSKLWA
jgi:hypothetical protein